MMNKLLVAAALLAGSTVDALQTVTPVTDCVDTAKVGNLNKQISDHGGAADAHSKYCATTVTKAKVFKFRGHTTIEQSPVETNCYDLAADATEFETAGCKIFTDVSADLRATKAALFTWFDAFPTDEVAAVSTVPIVAALAPMPTPTEAFYLAHNDKIFLTDYDWTTALSTAEVPGKMSVSHQKAMRDYIANHSGMTEKTVHAFRTATSGQAEEKRQEDLAARNKAKKYVASFLMQAMGQASSVVTHKTSLVDTTGTTALAKERKTFANTMIKVMHEIKANSEPLRSFLAVKTNLDAKIRALIETGSFYADHVGGTHKRALKCLPVTLAYVGLAGGDGLNDDVAYKCADAKTTFTNRPACSRLAVAQLLNWNRSPYADTAAPWKLVSYKETGKWTATKMRMGAKYATDELMNKCASAVRVNNGDGTKTGPKRVICHAFTECYRAALTHVGATYSGCTTTVEDLTTTDDNAQELGVSVVLGQTNPNDGLMTDQL